MNRAIREGTDDTPATGPAEDVAALEARVRLLELALADYAQRYGLTDLARAAMVRDVPDMGGNSPKG
jgi:hypothetical protein